MHLCACACMGIEIVTKPDFQDILIIDDLYCVHQSNASRVGTNVRVDRVLVVVVYAR